MIINQTGSGGKKIDYPIFKVDNTGKFVSIDPWQEPATLPAAISGQYINPNITIIDSVLSAAVFEWIVVHCKSLIIPSYFRNASLKGPQYYENGWMVAASQIEEIENNAVTDGNIQLFECLYPNLKKITTNYDGDVDLRITANDLEKITVVASTDGNIRVWSPSSDTGMREVDITADNAVSFDKPGGTDKVLIKFHGRYSLKGAKRVGEFELPYEYHTDAYLDSLEEFNNTSIFYGFRQGWHSDGTMDMYIGEHLQPLDNTIASHFQDVMQYLTIHIPPGINTTKTTLDAAGISYVQDYMPGGNS